MTQASPQWQRWVNQVGHQFDFLWYSKSFKRLTAAVEQRRGWLLCVAIGLLLLIWNWQLVVSSGVGLGALVAVYLIHQGQWRLPIEWQLLWLPARRPVTLAVLSGIVVSVCTYVSIAVWRETQGSWVAKAMLLQGAASLAILLLLAWQTIERYVHPTSVYASANAERPDPRTVERLLSELSDADALKRLMAVRRLTGWVQQSSGVPSTDRNAAIAGMSAPLSVTHLADCFRLMLNRETDPAVCRALLDSLHQLHPQLNSQPRSLQSGQMSFSPTMSPTMSSANRMRG